MVEILGFALFTQHTDWGKKESKLLREKILCDFNVIIVSYYHSYVDSLFLVSRDELISKLVEENKVSFEVVEFRDVLSSLHYFLTRVGLHLF